MYMHYLLRYSTVKCINTSILLILCKRLLSKLTNNTYIHISLWSNVFLFTYMYQFATCILLQKQERYLKFGKMYTKSINLQEFKNILIFFYLVLKINLSLFVNLVYALLNKNLLENF